MLTLSIPFFLIAGPAVVFAGISKGGFGSGASFAGASVLALVVEPRAALGVMLPLLLLIDFFSLKPYWGKWHRQAAILLVMGAVPGVVLGVILYQIAEPDVFRVLIGMISLSFVTWHVMTRRGWVRSNLRYFPPSVGILAGVFAGFTSFVSHAGGPSAAVYLLSRDMAKTEFQATTVLVFWIVNIAKFIPYAFLGMFSAETGLANLLLAPFALLGVWIGVKAHDLFPEKLFFGFTYVLLVLTGVKLIWDGFN